MQPFGNTLLLLPIREQDHVHGPESAPLTLVEYGDYECPACGQLFVILRDVQETLGDRLRIVYRHYPLSGAHPHAQEAAEAAEAAGEQGRFWEMHDLLFQHQASLKRKDLLGYAESLGLDMPRFRSELTGSMYRDRVREDFRHGVQNGVYGTPGLFLNGVRHDEAWDRATLLQKLTSAT
jgi:protein-disulfide isomerase